MPLTNTGVLYDKAVMPWNTMKGTLYTKIYVCVRLYIKCPTGRLWKTCENSVKIYLGKLTFQANGEYR